MSPKLLRDGLSKTLSIAPIFPSSAPSRRKVRDNYTSAAGRRTLIVSDRISTFDVVVGTLPYKVQVLTRWRPGGSPRPDHRAQPRISVPDPNVLVWRKSARRSRSRVFAR